MRVLIVDDEAGIRKLLVRWLSAASYQTAVAGDVTGALEIAGGSDEEPATLSLRPGVIAYLVKPFTNQAVLDTVGAAKQWHEAQAQEEASSTAGQATDPIVDWLQKATIDTDPGADNER